MYTFGATKDKNIVPNAARRIFGVVRNELELVESEFRRQASSNVQVINYLGDYISASGGKRVRPALLVLSAYSVGGSGSSENAIRLATVMEMLHTATLVHDDIIDNADLRRNRASVNAKFGNQAAVLMGDWLYMSAFETSLKERSLEILDILTRLTRKMTEGELIQLTMIGNTAITRDEYFDILKRKTAYLFSGCCEIGAIIGGASHDEQTALRDFGMNLGIAFQLADDLLDFTADERALGKAAGADLLEGKITLPLIVLQEKMPEVRAELEHIMFEGVYDDVSRSAVSNRLLSTGVLETIRETALSYASGARKNLEILPESEYRLALDGIPNFVVERNS